MKELELTIYPLRDEVGPMLEPGYIVNGHPVTEWSVWYEVHRKRLSDAELAAEHWSYCTGWYVAVRDDDDYEGAPATRELKRRAQILERFATLPHYDEVGR